MVQTLILPKNHSLSLGKKRFLEREFLLPTRATYPLSRSRGKSSTQPPMHEDATSFSSCRRPSKSFQGY